MKYREAEAQRQKHREAEADILVLILVRAAFRRGDPARGGYDATRDRLEGP